MTRAKYVLLMVVCWAVVSADARAERLDCGTNRHMEVVTYDWELDGFLSWIAAIRFPTSGSGTLATVTRANGSIATELRIVSSEGEKDLYQYQSEIEPSTFLTLVSVDGYKFDGRQRSMTTTFDYAAKSMRREKRDTKKGSGTTTKVETMPHGDIRDVLSVIYHLRKSATSLQKPTATTVYSAGKLYNVMLSPGRDSVVTVAGTKVTAKQYTISATETEKKKWPGDVSFWLTRDAQATPVRIVIRQRGASLVLNAKALYNCP